MSKLFLESLNKDSREVFLKLKEFKKIGILGGGTALALQIGHRLSYDFDIFTDNKLNPYLWAKSKKVFGKYSYRTFDKEYQLNLVTPESIYVTFFYDDDYKSQFKAIKTKSIDLMDIRDIATNKAFTIGRRPKWRDYVDIYSLLKGKYITLEKIISLSKNKFGRGFSEKLFLEQLTYWGDIKKYKIKYIGEKVEPDEIKELLLFQAKKFTSKLFN
ncbi:MAG: hypothetical protein Q8Q30_02260 [Candidatus Woesebacteria bacterium]|nr:hypothetical protein [Candidatus Woesebacteria bacterium]